MKHLKEIDLADTEKLCKYTNELLQNANAKFGIGGYNELRTMYSRSSLFNNDINKKNSVHDEPRRLHIGVDISGKKEQKFLRPSMEQFTVLLSIITLVIMDATIILSHQFDGITFYTLYGHLSLADLQNINEGDIIKRGQQFAHFGSTRRKWTLAATPAFPGDS